MSLKEELAARKAEFMGKAPPEIREAMMRADQELHASGIVGREPVYRRKKRPRIFSLE